MEHELLIVSSLAVAFIHTLFGPDHYVPFVVLARARRWTFTRLGWVVFLCGVGHVLSSILLGMLGLGMGISLHHLVSIESARGDVAAWLLIAFGLIYMVWGVRQAMRGRSHTHLHTHGEDVHSHTHSHEHDHLHVHDRKGQITPWVLFIIFFFGPCEPLIPLFIYPASQQNWGTLIGVTVGFSAVTVITMLTLTMMLYRGVSLIPFARLERWTHAMAGSVILMAGISVAFLGL